MAQFEGWQQSAKGDQGAWHSGTTLPKLTLLPSKRELWGFHFKLRRHKRRQAWQSSNNDNQDNQDKTGGKERGQGWAVKYCPN